MTLAKVPPRRVVPPSPPRPAPRRLAALPWLLVAGVVAQVCVRLWFARARTGPVADPDETGYLLVARWLAGGHGADYSGHTFYQGGYPLLLVPANWLSDDLMTVYTLAMATNALIGAALFPLGYLALRRLGLARRPALPLAWAAALLPETTFFGAFTLTDAVLPTLVLAWLLALDRFVRDGRTGSAVLASAAASYLASVHMRGTMLLAVHGAVLGLLLLAVVLVRWRRVAAAVGADRTAAITRRARGTAAGLAVAAAGYAAGAALNARVKAEMYPDGAKDHLGIMTSRLTSVSGQEWALSGSAGQVWYMIVATWGLAGIGLAAVLATPLRRRAPAADRVMAAVLLVATAGVAYSSSAALPDEHRIGNYAYGRYLSCIVLVYALVGAVALLRSRTRRAAQLTAAGALLLSGSAAWVTAYAGDRLETFGFIAFDFPEPMFLTGDRTALHMPEVTLAGAGLLCCALLLTRARVPRVAALLLAGGLVGINLAAMTFAMGPKQDRVRPASPLAGPQAGGVVVDQSVYWVLRVKFQYPVDWTRVERPYGQRNRPPAPGVCTVVLPLPNGTAPEASWPAHPPAWRFRAGRAYSTGWVTWWDPACPAARR
ncbi:MULTISPECIES: hypothetical protein [Actinomadura]|uniref:Glycosyltransferase RgtA/B/C/D-like domain-containing protein n=1 Tax=Actinomadura litoris TaxID=2678616 RepID=A0A7K1L750_9ACTN|nr:MULTISPECIES: hypothetical protein [Actinomadura]MBT2209573.1 hypothetical protein [Actinomadura sp. NEAU-AAG7]MUN40264.1 hypothetical protein [Actinomadura litoris]